MPIEAGEPLLHYRLIEKIGEGGMGAVWRARDTTLEREVAIKVLPEAVAHDAERLARFDREAKLLASLNHPNVAAIYGFHRAEGISFLAMELVEGEDLSQRLARGPLPVEEALDVFRQIAEALEAAHERGVVHRDLKPANVKLAPDGKIKVLDFGLAKAMSPESASGSANPATSPTMTTDGTRAGMILGTAAYMSPEQARGRPLDRRTDLWSFGCVMHESLTGTQLFRGETVSDSLAAILRKEVDWSELPPDTPPILRRLLGRCLTRDARKRLQDAGDARVELEQAIEEPSFDPAPAGEVAAPVESGGRRWLPWIVAAVGVLAAIFLWLQREPTASDASIARRLTIAVPGPTRFGDLAASPPVVSPDGRLVAFGVSEDTTTKLWLRPLDDFAARPLSGTDGAQYAFWSPDSRHVGFFRGGKLRRMELATGREQGIGGIGSSYPRGASWNARGQIVFSPNSNSAVLLIEAAGGEARPVTTLDPEIPDASHRWPWFLPDGEHFLYTLWTNDLDAREQYAGVYAGSIDGETDPKRIVPDASNAVYSDTGHLVFARGGSVVALPFDPERRRVTGQPAVLATGVLGNSSNGHHAFAASNEGTLVYATGQAFPVASLVWYDRSGETTPISVEPAPFYRVVLAPGGRRAAAMIPGDTGDGEVWIVDLERGVRMRLVHGATQYDYPLWSSDGERIMYGSQDEGSLDFFVRRADGSGDAEPVMVDEIDKVLFDWSPDGRYLAFWPMGSGSGTSDLWIYSIEGETAKPFATGDTVYVDARFSPDGRWLTYVSDAAGRREVFVQALAGEDRMTAGARLQVSTAGGAYPHWREDGRELIYLDPDQRVTAVAIGEQNGRLQLGAPQVLFTIPGAIVAMDATRDHRRLLVAQQVRVESDPLRVVLDWPTEIGASRPADD